MTVAPGTKSCDGDALSARTGLISFRALLSAPILLTGALLLALTLADILAASLPQAWLGADPRYAIATQGDWLQHFSAWDSLWYERIAKSGYQWVRGLHEQQSIAFFPLWPMVLRALLDIGLHGYAFRLTSLLITAGFCIAAIAEMQALARRLLPSGAAFWATVFYVSYPASLFDLHAYPTALMHYLTLAGLNALHERRWWRAALLSGIATAAGPLAVALAGMIALLALFEQKPLYQRLGLALLAASGLLGFCLWQFAVFGDAFAFIHAQAGWSPSPVLPVRIIRTVLQLLVAPDLIQTAIAWRDTIGLAHIHDLWGAQHQFQGGLNTASLALCIVGTAASFRLKPRIVFMHGVMVIGLYAWFMGAAIPGWATMRLLGLTPAPFIGAAAVLGRAPRLAIMVALSSALLLICEEFAMSAGYGVI